ncbi:MarP family serine protease [Actinomadura barringtoniae]|uniref:MarP family serine protease n=1 Tax=Actinomadura barringtoniae TaxID=1427535 RepID=A0A939PDD4_9ACTN|nr:MarP family serine protease [Actinomadura barringtoniae]MBO2450545.1 MarP family serine protease [Actinomadura barringtoniae]
MPFTEQDLRELLVDHGGTEPAPAFLLAETVERRGRRVRRRLRVTAVTAGAAAVACAATAVLVLPGLGDHEVPGPLTTSEVAPPNDDVLKSGPVQRAIKSVVKLTATAPQCQRRIDGTGFVYAPRHVMTNAHVVAGSQGTVKVRSVAGKQQEARVVLYDPVKDIAVLYVPGLTAAPLAFTPRASVGDDAAVVGFPKGGPLTASAARIRARQTATGLDIYHRSRVSREIYTIRGHMEPGDAGGPLLTPQGTVLGMNFAAALDTETPTAYALTAGQVASAAQQARNATAPVSTEGCSD